MISSVPSPNIIHELGLADKENIENQSGLKSFNLKIILTCNIYTIDLCHAAAILSQEISKALLMHG